MTLDPAILHLVAGWSLVAGVAGAGALAVWLWSPKARGPLLPPQRRRAVPWGFHQIVIVGFAAFFWEESLSWLLRAGVPSATETGAQLVGDAVTASLIPGAAGRAAVVTGVLTPRYFDWLSEVTIRSVIAILLATPLQFLTVVFALRHFADARPYQLGLTGHRWAKDVVAGFWVWLSLTPFVYLVYLGAIQFFDQTTHPLEWLFRTRADGQVFTLVVLSALVARPVMEELLFRGVLQPWMSRAPIAADLSVMVVLVGVVVGGESGGVAWRAWILVAAGAGYLLFERLTWRWLPRVGAARAIYASSLLFAAIHASVWPTPIPLFFLSLGLGFLAYRTQSLVGPILIHVLFNAVSVAEMLIT